ncbi:hypothetical protein FRC03_000584 [Tulasnella sp. 419]|nr:hypothetical protein FRC03_000584 [Tulasnella sp. 419]
MSSLQNIAVAGATGNLGTYIINALLSPTFRPKFGEIIALSRSATSDAAKALIARGVKVVEIDIQNVDSLAEALKGIDVFVDAIVSTPDTTTASSNFIKAAAKSEVKLYIPSEFSFDYQRIDFEHPFWEGKRAIAEEAIKAGLRVARISVSAFLEDSFSSALDTNRFTLSFAPTRSLHLALT